MPLFHFRKMVKFVQALAAKANVTTDANNGTSVDQRAIEQFAAGCVLINVGAATGSPSSFSVVYTLEESDDDSTFTTAQHTNDSASGDATVTVTAAGNYSIEFEPGRLKRYYRLKRAVTITGGSSPTLPNAAVFLLGDPRKQPVS